VWRRNNANTGHYGWPLNNNLTGRVTIANNGNTLPLFILMCGKQSSKVITPKRGTVAYEIANQDEHSYPKEPSLTFQEHGWHVTLICYADMDIIIYCEPNEVRRVTNQDFRLANWMSNVA
jgi:hypothetical protein